MPLDRAGDATGTIALSIERKLASATPSRDAVVALAGGPGQAAIPLAEFAAQAIAPALGSRDLIVFDQRGTGTSDPLNCPIFNNTKALEHSTFATFGELARRCALEIGPARGGFTSEESVEDIEAIRKAYGYEKLVLYGTSYGTKVAEEYAERYPQNVEALVLDSVVPSNGPEPFEIPRFEAIRRVVDELCSDGACAGITSNPTVDIAQLAARLRKHELRGFAYDGNGRRHSVSMNEPDLYDVLLAGDLNPAVRAFLPAAVRSALDGYSEPLLRLNLLANGDIPDLPRKRADREAEEKASQEENNALFLDTTCEETPFPWGREANLETREREAFAALQAVPESDFYPFISLTTLVVGRVLECDAWPDASPPPSSPGALPNVPTLILSGEQDIRTPTSEARSVAEQIPDAQLLLVPFTGHSVIGSDLSDCASLAVSAFFAGEPVQPCAPGANPFAPTPISPPGLADVRPPSGLRGNPGRTLSAVLDTLLDLNRQVIAATLQADQKLPSGTSFGGLRGGYAKLTSSTVILHDFSLVPGVELNAAFPVRDGELQATNIRIAGAQAAHGTIRFGSKTVKISGRLGGKSFDVSVAKVERSRAGSNEWPSQAAVDRLVARRAARTRGTGLALAGLP